MRIILPLILSLAVVLAAGCSTKKIFDINTPEGRQAVIDEVNNLLTNGQCDAAIDMIEPLYASQYTNNEVRLLRAAAHGCKAGIDFWPLIGELLAGDLVGSGFWRLMTRLFPSTSDDNKMESGQFSQDALMAVINPGVVIGDPVKFNGTTGNPGSVKVSDRTDDSNMYMIFVGMAGIGTTQNRYGLPDASYAKTVPLPFDTYATQVTDGCAYVGSIINMLDGIDLVSGEVSGDLASTLTTISSNFSSVINQSCGYGCAGLDITGAAQIDMDCNFAQVDCNPCPIEIRNRTMCMASDKAKCATAGVVRMINQTPLIGWQ